MRLALRRPKERWASHYGWYRHITLFAHAFLVAITKKKGSELLVVPAG
jgi:hypothetical protein